MLPAHDIAVGMVAWPDPSHLTTENGCRTPWSMHNAIHPMVCLDRDDECGVWIVLSTREKTAGGRIKRKIPSSWRIGSATWIEREQYMGFPEASVVVPHQVMEQATRSSEFSSQLRHRIKPEGCAELLEEVRKAGGHVLELKAKTTRPTLTLAPKRARLTQAEYEELAERAGRGETIAELARAFRFPAARIEQYLAYRSKRVSAKDLTGFSAAQLRQALEAKEQEEAQASARAKIEKFAKSLGYDVSGIELKRAPT